MTTSMCPRRAAPLLLALSALLAAGGACAQDWPDVPLPGDARGEWVSRHMVYNGVNMRTSRFASPLPLAEVEAFYREHWRGRMARDVVAGRTILGHARGDFYITVELRPRGTGTQGQIGISEALGDRRRAQPGAGFQRPSGTRVMEDIIHRDTPRQTRTLHMVNRHSPQQNQAFYQRALSGRGYVRTSNSPACSASQPACVAYYEKGRDRIVINASRNAGNTSVMVIQM
ncbi:MAG: hypothetical protein Q4F49_01895 [Pseudoxanthomonas suwonensis]|nr:hypothetical protein [Pseudoxanthomonas suwonensis]